MWSPQIPPHNLTPVSCCCPEQHLVVFFLLNICETFFVSTLQPGSKMVTSAKSSVPTVTDQAAAMQLGQCAKNLATCLAELRTSAQKVVHTYTLICGSACRKSLSFYVHTNMQKQT